jgi:hypothetical protein
MATKKKTSKTPGSQASPPKKASTKKSASSQTPKVEVGVESVHLGHIHALRPRVNTSFSQAEFLNARRELAKEGYGSIEEAARAVAEKALAGANRKPSKRSIGR